jgi:lysozyme
MTGPARVLRRARRFRMAWTMTRFSALRLASALVPLTAVTLLGCGTQAPGDGPIGEAEEASVCATGAVVYGVDVSIYQGSVDWASVKGAGKDFAIARISDGTGTLDNTFATHWAGIKNAGMIRGAYQFFEPGEDPTAQANIVINAVGTLADGDLPVVADMEVTGGQGAATIVANLQTWVSKVQAGTGKAPMIYTAEGYWDGSVGSTAFGNLPLWAANWGVTCPTLATGWSTWKVWQYADNGTVSGISGNVDLDEFNGDLTALQAFAGGAPDWGAQYVSQSWPLATMTMTMTVNQQLPASITLKNIGAKTWDTNTRIGTTQPRDRMSPFVGPDWLAPNRLSAVTGTVAPGSDFKFTWTFQAPNTPGMYDEFYGVVEEGVAWFSDPGQAGPPDNDIEAKVQVVEAQYHGEFVSQTFPTLQDPPITMTPGQTMTGSITLKNVGTATWKAGVTKLAPTPRDKPSPVGATGWLSPTRVSSPPMDVPTGQSYAFPLTLTAGAPGTYTQTFSLVEESVTWFADAPAGGGPPDDLLAVKVVVTGPDGGSGAGGDGAGGDGAGASGTGGGEGADGGTGAGSAGAHKGCGCRAAGEDGGPLPAGAWLAVAGLAAVVGRRRR